MNITTNETSASGDAHPHFEIPGRQVQSLRAGNVCIEHESQLYADEYDNPEYVARIVISGRPAGKMHTANHAAIYFYADGDERIGMPQFNEKSGCIMMHLPLSEFESYVEMMRSHQEVQCSFIETGSGRVHAVVYGRSPMPEQLH